MDKNFYAGLSLGLILGISLSGLLFITYSNNRLESADIRQYSALHEMTNNTINGIYFPMSSFCIHMNRDNVEALKKTLDHETLHELIENNHTCGNETCWEHFCE